MFKYLSSSFAFVAPALFVFSTTELFMCVTLSEGPCQGACFNNSPPPAPNALKKELIKETHAYEIWLV